MQSRAGPSPPLRQTSEYQVYYFFAILIALIAFVNVVVHSKARAAEKPPAQGYYDQQLLNYRYTEVCALGKVPKELIAAAQKFQDTGRPS